MKIFKKQTLKRAVIFIAITMAAITLVTWYANYVVAGASAKFIYSNAEQLPKAHTGVLLGTSPTLKSGRPNLYFTYRIEAAAELFNAGKIDYLIISGDNSRKEYDEPTEMKKALMAKGVDSTRIFLDYAGFRTFDSVVRAKKIFGQDTIIFISQHFHNERAIYIARENNMVAYGYDAKDVSKKYGLKTMIREKFARVKVFLDILFGTNPHFLGEKIIIPE